MGTQETKGGLVVSTGVLTQGPVDVSIAIKSMHPGIRETLHLLACGLGQDT